MALSSSEKEVIFIVIFLILMPYFNLFLINYSNFGVIKGDELKISDVFDPNEIDLSLLPPIDYEGLDDMWYHQGYEMLIVINDSSFLNAVKPLVEWKNAKGVKTIVSYNYSDYEGRDKAEKIRNMIKYFYDREEIRWVLLAGDAQENLIPIRYVYNPDTVEIEGESEYSNWDEYYKPTDFYYADLTGSWDDNNNDIFGESSHYSGNIDEISWTPEVYVGRLPADNPTELSFMINKTLKYESNPYIGDWMNKMLLASGMSSYFPPEDEVNLTQYIWHNYVLEEMNFTHLIKYTDDFSDYLSTPPPPNQQYILNNTNFVDGFNSGYSTVIFAGHGDPTRFTDSSSTTYYDNNDAQSNINNNMPSLVYADVCTTAPYDQLDSSIGERLIKQPVAGAVGYIGGLRVTWYFENDENLEKLNRGNAKLFWREFFVENKYQQGMALYDSKISYLNSDYFKQSTVSTEQEWERKNLLSYNLLGDPELDIYTNIPKAASNPFNSSYYGGQLVSVGIRDNMNNLVPRARLNLKSNDGKNYTVYANENGIAQFRLPAQPYENYSGLITGHNLLPTLYNFTTIPDSNTPKIEVISYPRNVTSLDNLFFSIKGSDNQSGIESIFLLLSNNNFQDFNIYKMGNGFLENNSVFNITLNKQQPGTYSFAFVVRDYTNKTSIHYEESFVFKIDASLMDFVLVIATIMIVGFAAISIVVIIRGLKKSRKLTRELENGI